MTLHPSHILRSLFGALLLAASLLPIAGAPARAEQSTVQSEPLPAALHKTIRITGPVIRLGDIFANLGAKTDLVVAHAPTPGKRITLDARWLYRIAQANDVDWRPLSERDAAVVVRESRTIGPERIAARVLDALIDQGVDPDSLVELSNPMLSLHVAADAQATLAVEEIAFDTRSRRFSAIVAAPADDAAARRVRISGRLHPVTEVPVLANQVRRGEIVRGRDVTYARIKTARLHRDAILDAADLIGMSPRRSLRLGAPVRHNQVRRPLLVAKRELLTVALKVGNLSLTIKARALEDGSKGDSIRVANLRSNTVIDVVVVGAGLAVLPTAQTVAMN